MKNIKRTGFEIDKDLLEKAKKVFEKKNPGTGKISDRMIVGVALQFYAKKGDNCGHQRSDR